MPELTKEEIQKREDWLIELLTKYFPDDALNRYPTEIFVKYLRFAGKDTLVLPRHLQYPEEELDSAGKPVLDSSGKPVVVVQMEFDIPEMIGHDPFRRLININHLVALRNEIALKKPFNIFVFLVRQKYGTQIKNEEASFSKAFVRSPIYHTFGHGVAYTEDIPDLFFKNFDNRNFSGEYNSETDSFTFIFTRECRHNPGDDIIKACRYFFRKIYNLRAFGLQNGIEVKDYISLRNELFKYLKDNIHFYRDLRRCLELWIKTGYTKNKLVLKQLLRHLTSNRSFFKKLLLPSNIDRISEFICAYDLMVEKELECRTGGNNIYVPTDQAILINNIRKKSNGPWLEREISKAEILEYFSGSEATTIRKKYNEIAIILSSELLSQKYKKILSDICTPKVKIGIEDIIKTMHELRNNPDNNKFLNEPYVKMIFTEPFKKLLDDLYPINKLDESKLPKENIEIIEKRFNNICVALSSGLLKIRPEEILANACTPIGIEDIIRIMNELLHDSDNIEFLNEPYVQKIFTDPFKNLLAELYPNNAVYKLKLKKLSDKDIRDIIRNIKNKFNVICVTLSSGLLKYRPRGILGGEGAPKGKGKFTEKLWALQQFKDHPDNQNLLAEPYIAKIFTPKFKKQLDEYYHRIPKSIFDPVIISDEDEGELVDIILDDKPPEIPVENKGTYNEALRAVLELIKTEFPNTVTNPDPANGIFVEKFSVYIEYKLRNIFIKPDPDLIIENIQKNIWSKRTREIFFKYYANLHGFIDIRLIDDIEEEFYVKMKKILRKFKEKINKWIN